MIEARRRTQLVTPYTGIVYRDPYFRPVNRLSVLISVS